MSYLHEYFDPVLGESGAAFNGSVFDGWDSTGTRGLDADRFTADDLVAVTFLSVRVGPSAAYQLLHSRAEEFRAMLAKVGPDRDLADVPDDSDEVRDESGPAWTVYRALDGLPEVGPTIASKLLARKRPRLLPVYDDVVARVMHVGHDQWEQLRLALRADAQALQKRLLRLRDSAGVPPEVSALRVLDVIAWREGQLQPR